jgi:hypothetical protein
MNHSRRSLAYSALAALAAIVPVNSAFAIFAVPSSSLSASSAVGIDQQGVNGNFDLSSKSSMDGSAVSASVTNQTYTGMDSTGAPRTLTFSGTNSASASFVTGLHVFASGSVTNSYYNPANTPAVDTSDNYNPAGSPTSFYSLGVAGFTDTLQFGGALQAGYQARYLFHVHGTNTDNFPFTGADMSFGITGNPDESFFATNVGLNDTIWATQTYQINGITPQAVHVDFSAQFVMNTFDHADGDNVSGTSDFSATLGLPQLEILDAAGNPVTGVTVTGASGTTFVTVVPEPVTIGLLFPSLLLLKRRRA